MSRLARPCLIALLLLMTTGCEQPQSASARSTTSVSIDEVLDRCVAAFGRLRSLKARGVLRDFRTEDRRMAPIAWDFVRPGRCRVEIGDRVAIVIDENWWTYDALGGQFRKHRSFTKTPMETAAYLISKGVSFLLPSVFARGEAAFGKSRALGYREWRLLGVAWSNERPCYVAGRVAQGHAGGTMLRVWIDQDSYLVRGWDMVRKADDGREVTILACTYQTLTPDANVPVERFGLTPPSREPSSKPGARGRQTNESEAGGATDL